MAERPSILINNYHTHRQQCLTMIFLWDERVSFLLSSRYDPLKAGRGEAGMGNNNDDEDDTSLSGLSSSYSSVKRRSPKKHGKKGKGVASYDGGIKETMSEIVNLIQKSSSNVSPSSSSDNRKTTGLTLVDLNSLYDKHVGHLRFLKENDMLTETRKVEIVRNIEEVYAMISETHGKKRNIDNCSGNSNSTVS